MRRQPSGSSARLATTSNNRTPDINPKAIWVLKFVVSLLQRGGSARPPGQLKYYLELTLMLSSLTDDQLASKILSASDSHSALLLPSTANSVEAKAAYRRIARRLHPDKCQTGSAQVTEAFQRASSAVLQLQQRLPQNGRLSSFPKGAAPTQQQGPTPSVVKSATAAWAQPHLKPRQAAKRRQSQRPASPPSQGPKVAPHIQSSTQTDGSSKLKFFVRVSRPLQRHEEPSQGLDSSSLGGATSSSAANIARGRWRAALAPSAVVHAEPVVALSSSDSDSEAEQDCTDQSAAKAERWFTDQAAPGVPSGSSCFETAEAAELRWARGVSKLRPMARPVRRIVLEDSSESEDIPEQ